MKNLDDKLTGQGNNLQQFFNAFNTAMQALDLSLLAVINNKLGPQLAGGVSTFLTNMLQRLNKIGDWLHLDRVLNVLTYVNTLHNAYMLSADLGQTLFSMISNVLAAIGIKDAEGQALDISQILGGQIDGLMKGFIGVTAWEGIKAEWKRLNRIYQAAANIVWAFQSISQSILNALEVVGSWVASIGNAMKKFGVIGEKAFGWMNQNPNFDSKFFRSLENAQNVVSQIDSVASEVLSVQQTITEITQQKEELQKALKQEDGTTQKPTPPEADKIKVAEQTAKVASQGATVTVTDTTPDED